MQVTLNVTLPDSVGADFHTAWLNDIKDHGTLNDSPLTLGAVAVTLGQALKVKTGDILVVDAEIMLATGPAGGDSLSVVPVARTTPVAHNATAPVSVLRYATPFSCLLPVLQSYALQVVTGLINSGLSQTFAGNVQGTIVS